MMLEGEVQEAPKGCVGEVCMEEFECGGKEKKAGRGKSLWALWAEVHGRQAVSNSGQLVRGSV